MITTIQLYISIYRLVALLDFLARLVRIKLAVLLYRLYSLGKDVVSSLTGSHSDSSSTPKEVSIDYSVTT